MWLQEVVYYVNVVLKFKNQIYYKYWIEIIRNLVTSIIILILLLESKRIVMILSTIASVLKSL